jgi:citrate lyase subunit beta/citryl-CoA lyase
MTLSPPSPLASAPNSSPLRPRRSLLYLPASNARALAKARTLGCDGVILDLEDSVAPDAKASARAQLVEALTAGGFGRREVVVRVNGLDTPWGEQDLEALAHAPPDAVLVPKVQDSGDIARYHARLEALPDRVQLWAMVETCRSLFHLESLAAASRTSRLACLVMGVNDLAKEMGAELEAGRTPFLTALSLSVAAARAYGLSILDGVFNGLEDAAGLEQECRQGRQFGFHGKTLIHPGQIEACNRVFSPTSDQIAWASTVVDAFAEARNAGLGAIRVAGQMVERLHLAQAERILVIHAAEREGG